MTYLCSVDKEVIYSIVTFMREFRKGPKTQATKTFFYFHIFKLNLIPYSRPMCVRG